jgi:hypothetical protein
MILTGNTWLWSNLRKQIHHEVTQLLFRIRIEHPSLRKHDGKPFLNLALCDLLHAMIMLLSDMPNPLVFSMENVKLCGVKSLQGVEVPVGKSIRCSVRVCVRV